MTDLFCDTETFCETPIAHGSYRYAESAEVMLFTWAIDDGPVQCWDLTVDPTFPPDLIKAASSDDTLVWFQNGDHFDWPVLAKALPAFVAAVPVSRRRDTMVQAYSHSLPGSLDMLGRALGLPEEDQKLKSGRRLMHLFCKPQNDAFLKKYGTRRATRHTHPQEWEDFKIYAGRDITAMRGCQRRMPSWNYRGKQLDLWALDQKINARGIFIDLELAQAAVRASDIAKRKLAGRTQELTDGDVQAATQRDEMLRHILETHGVSLPDMKADTIERRIKDESLPEELRELLRVRLASTTSSVAKFSTLIRGVNSDGRIRGTMQFRGAQRTGRCGHRLLQPGNMPRPDMKAAEIAFAIEMLKLDCAHLVFGNVMRVCSNAIRGLIAAPKGSKLVVADLANIEGRFAAWLAGEAWKLQAFRDYDTIIGRDAEGKPLRAGPDLYCVAYGKSFNVDPSEAEADSAKRQIGKVQELMFSFGGGVGAWITGAATYGIDLQKMTEAVYPTLPDWAIEEARGFLQWMYQGPQGVLDKKLTECRADALTGLVNESAFGETPAPLKTHRKFADEIEQRMQAARDLFEARCLKLRHGLTERTFIACDSLKRLWRKAHPEITSFWKEIEETVRACIYDKGVQRQCRKLKIRCDGAWLRIGLPSGRVLCYPSPGIDVEVTLPTGKKKVFSGISYLGISQYTKQWERIGTYGPKVFENVVQAGSADQLFECQPLIEEAGYPIVLHIHDENICETPDDPRFTSDELGRLMCSRLSWNEGLPLAAAGFEGYRYRKG